MASFEPNLFKLCGNGSLEEGLNSILLPSNQIRIVRDNKRFHLPMPRPGMPFWHVSFGGVTYEIQMANPQNPEVVGKVSIVGYDNDPNMNTISGFYEEIMAFRTCKPLNFRKNITLPSSYILAKRVKQDHNHIAQMERKDYWDPKFFSKASGESPLLRALIPDYMLGTI